MNTVDVSLLCVLILGGQSVGRDLFGPSYQGNGVNGIPGIVMADVRQNTPRGVVNSVEYHLAPRPSGEMKLIPSELAVLTYNEGWFSAYSKDDPEKAVNAVFLKQNAFWYVSGDPRVEVLVQFGTGQLAVIKRSQHRNAPAGNVIGLAAYSSVAGLRSQVILNRLGNPVQTIQTADGGVGWVYYGQIVQRGRRTLRSNQTTTGMIGNDFVGLDTTSETTVAVERPLVLWNFVVAFKRGPGDDLRVTGLTSGQTGPGEWKVVPAP
jgi:hypothetical protein